MNKTQRRAAKQKAHERRHRANRQRRRDSDVCAHLLFEAGMAWDVEQDTDRARQLLEKALRLRPSHTEARQRLAELLFETGRDDEGLAHYAQLSRPPDWPLLVHMAAMAAWRLGRVESAAALLREFLDQTRYARPLQPLRRAARTLLAECRKEVRRAKRQAARAVPGAEALPLLRAIDTEAAPVPAPVTPVPTPTVPDAEAALPSFPSVPLPPLEIRFEVQDREFLAGLAPGQAAGPIRDVLLRRDYARLRLQKGFDELVSLAAIRDVVHFRYQLDTVRRIVRDFRGRVLLADEVGLGKTIEACLALKEYWLRGLVRKALILTPPSLVSQWVDELTSKFGLTPVTPDDAPTSGAGNTTWRDHPLVVASLPFVRQPAQRDQLVAIDYDLVIVDEAHCVKNRGTAAWQLVNDLKKRFLLLLTATPVGHDLSELYNLILLLRPGLLKTQAQFRREYGRRHALDDPTRREKLRTLLREVMVRNTRERIDLKLPRRVAATQVVQPDSAEAAVLDTLSAYIRRRYHDATAAERWRLLTLQMQAGSSPAALRSGLRKTVAATEPDGLGDVARALERVATSAKTPALIDLARRSREKKIVFTHFRATQDELRQALGTAGFDVAIVHGGLTASEKDRAIAAFEARAEILLSSGIGGEGRNLQFCRTVINYDLPWNPMTIEQHVGRVHRIGQERDVYVFNFCLAGSVEERILAILHDTINLFELVAGEIEMILGHLDDEQDLASVVMDVWATNATPTERDAAFEALSTRILTAKTRYEQTRDLDQSLFSENYEV